MSRATSEFLIHAPVIARFRDDNGLTDVLLIHLEREACGIHARRCRNLDSIVPLDRNIDRIFEPFANARVADRHALRSISRIQQHNVHTFVRTEIGIALVRLFGIAISLAGTAQVELFSLDDRRERHGNAVVRHLLGRHARAARTREAPFEDAHRGVLRALEHEEQFVHDTGQPGHFASVFSIVVPTARLLDVASSRESAGSGTAVDFNLVAVANA
jgi:hypothetical protein